MNGQTVGFGAGALVVGVALGYFIHALALAPAPATVVEEHAPKAALATEEGAEAKALRLRLKALEAELAAARSSAETVVTQKVAEIGFPRNEKERKRFGEEMKARFEEWKRNNPEEFAKMEKRRQEFMARRAEKAKNRLAFLASIDTSKMSEGDKAVHEQLQGLLAKREELETKMQAMPDLSDEERESLMGEMRETSQAIREANAQERDILFKQTAEALGFSGDDAGEITATLKEVIDATSGDGHGGHGPGGPGGPGGGR